MDDTYEAILEILENGMKEEYMLAEIATKLAESLDILIEKTNINSEKIEAIIGGTI